MRSKRLTMLMLGAVMALSTLGLSATAVSADFDEHPNVLVKTILVQEKIDTAGGNWAKARASLSLIKALRHWSREHTGSDAPGWVRRNGDCADEFNDDFRPAAYRYARTAFAYYRGKATNFREYPAGWERDTVRVRQMLIMKRAGDRLDDEIEDVLDECFFNGRMGQRLRYLIG